MLYVGMLVVKATAASSPREIAIASQASTLRRLAARKTGLSAVLTRLDNCALIRLNIAFYGERLPIIMATTSASVASSLGRVPKSSP